MASRLQLSGFTELQAELAALPTRTRDHAAPILTSFAERARAAIVSAYPRVTGELRAGVRVVTRTPRGIAALYTVVTSAPYAHIVEFGSAYVRPRAIFLPITGRERRGSVVAVARMVETTTGLKVTGARD